MIATGMKLTQKQADVLQWIKNGCPSGAYDKGYQHRIVARALHRRGLVSVTGHGSTWQAALTEAGAAWQIPPVPKESPSNATALAEPEEDHLLARVLAANGRLPLDDDSAVDACQRLIRLSMRSPNRPHGKKLEMRYSGRWGEGPQEIVLVEHLDDYVDVIPVPVPQRVSKYHPAVKAYVNNKDWQLVTRDHVPRAARILQALADEAPKRCVEVLTELDAEAKNDYRARKLARAHLVLRAAAGLYSVKIRELSGKGAKRTERRYWNQRGPAWIEERGWEFISTGQLELIIDGPLSAYNGDRYRDGKTVSVEEKLPDVFCSFEIHRLRAESREREK